METKIVPYKRQKDIDPKDINIKRIIAIHKISLLCYLLPIAIEELEGDSLYKQVFKRDLNKVKKHCDDLMRNVFRLDFARNTNYLQQFANIIDDTIENELNILKEELREGEYKKEM